MTLTEQILTIAILVAATALTRFLPFILFRGDRTPRFIQYLSQVLPPAVFAMLVVFCFKDVAWLSGHHGVPELLGLAATVGLHLWRRNFMLSIAGGTIAYMLLVRFVFI